MTIENPTNSEQPKEKRTLLELAAEERTQALKAQQKVEQYQALADENMQAITNQETSSDPNEETLIRLRLEHDGNVSEAAKWLEIAERYERMAQGYERKNNEIRN